MQGAVLSVCLVGGCVYALFPRIQEKKSIVAADFLIWGSKVHHMLGAGSSSLPNITNCTATHGEDTIMHLGKNF